MLLRMAIGAAIDFDNRSNYYSGMRTKDVIEHFGSQAAVADALGIKQPSVAGWGEFVPPLRQVQIEKLTGGKFKAAPDIFGPAPAQAEAQQ